MFCGNCGENLLNGAKFCGACGEKTDAAPLASGAAAPPPPSYPPAQSYTPQQSYRPQQGYAPPSAGGAPGQSDTAPMRMSEYLIMLLLMCIPIANIILLFMWSFGASVNLNKRNLARAYLIYAAAALVLSLLFSALFAGVLSSLFYSFY